MLDDDISSSSDDTADEHTFILRHTMGTPASRPSSSPESTNHVYLVGTVAAIGGLLFGYDTGVVSGALLWIREDMELTFAQQSLVVSITVLFCAIFSLVGGVLSDRVGRRRTIMAAGSLFVAGSALLGLAPTLWVLLAGRAVVGAGVGASPQVDDDRQAGMASMVVPPYIAECSPVHVRGRMVLVFQLLITFGQFVATVLAGVLSMPWADPEHVGWRIMLALAAVPAIVQLLAFVGMPESPRWLVEHDRVDEAKAVIARMYTTDEWRDYELAEIVREHTETREARIEQSRGGSTNTLMLVLRTSHVRRALLVGCSLQAFQQLAGINTLMYFTATIINMSGIGNAEDAIWLSSLASGTNFIFTLVPLLLIERLGRRKLLLGSTAAVIASLLFLAGGFLAIHETAPMVTSTVNLTASNAENGWTTHCASLTLCDDCVTSEHCGYCEVHAHDSLCLPVDLDTTTDVSSIGVCANTSNDEDTLTSPKWQYNYCASDYSWLVLVGMLVYLFSFTVGMGPIPWVLNAEIYPNWARGTAVAIATATNWAFNFVISETFLQLTVLLDKHGVFVLYACITAVAFVVFYLFVPETSGLPTEQVPLLFRRKRGRNRTKL